MDLTKALKEFSYFNLINVYFEKYLRKLFFYKHLNKKKSILRNIIRPNDFLNKIFSNKLNIEKIREEFYYKHLFAYSRNIEKSELLEKLKTHCPDEVRNYIEYANQIVNKEVIIFNIKKKFKDNINWHYGFYKNFEWPLENSEKINFRLKNKEVDVKYVWELNRHQYFTYLGFAYYYTKEEKYAEAFKLLILDWIAKNPPLYGINWVSGLEISLRLTSWIFSLYFFKDSEIINNNFFFKKIFCSMMQHAYYLRHFYTRRSFNHTIGDLFGVYLFSKLFQNFTVLKKWEKKFFKKLNEQLLLQTRQDGSNIEQSVNYHRFVLEFFLLYYILNQNLLNEAQINIINNMFDYLLYIVKPNQTLPIIGDNDDGKVLLLTAFDKNPFIHLFNLASILFRRPELKFISKKITPPTILLLGSSGAQFYDNLEIKQPTDNIKIFEEAGYYIIRSGWNKNSNYLFFDCGRFGPLNAPHSHSSISNVIFSYNGKDILIDSGTYTYNKSWKERNEYRQSFSHNILTINNMNQAKLIGWFAWTEKPKINRRILFKDDHIELSCYHNGYPNFIIARKLKLKKNLNQISILDIILPLKEGFNKNFYDVNIYFHFNKDLDLKIEKNNLIIDNNLLLEIFSDQYVELKLEKGFYSPYYGFKYEINVLNIYLKTNFKGKNSIQVKSEIRVLK